MARPEFFANVLRQAEESAAVYFNTSAMQELYDLNRKAYLDLLAHPMVSEYREQQETSRGSQRRADEAQIRARLQQRAVWSHHVHVVDSDLDLRRLLRNHSAVLLIFNTEFCRFCTELRPVVNEASASTPTCASLKFPRSPSLPLIHAKTEACCLPLGACHASKVAAELAQSAQRSVAVAVVYGPEHLELRDRYGIVAYPTILRLQPHNVVTVYPE
jgi:hypothetical protein